MGISDYVAQLSEFERELLEKTRSESHEDGYNEGYDDGWSHCFEVTGHFLKNQFGIQMEDFTQKSKQSDRCELTVDLFGFNP